MPTRTVRTKIAGVTFDDPVSGRNRQELIERYVRPGMHLRAVYEPDNPHGDSAIGLWMDRGGLFRKKRSFHVGYIPHGLADNLVRDLHAGRMLDVRVSEVTGGTHSKSSRGVNLIIYVHG